MIGRVHNGAASWLSFGWRGLAVVVIVAAIIGPPRDFAYMARFPEWGGCGPGVAPVLAIAATSRNNSG